MSIHTVINLEMIQLYQYLEPFFMALECADPEELEEINPKMYTRDVWLDKAYQRLLEFEARELIRAMQEALQEALEKELCEVKLITTGEQI